MRSRILRTLPILLFSVFLAGCQLNPFTKKAGVQITSHPDANVIINGKSVSKTPFYDENLTPGNATIQMTAIDSGQSWEGKVNLVSGTLTTVHREFGSTPDKSSSYSLSFEKLANNKDSSVSIISLPTNATVSIDGKPAGFTPATADIAPGNHTFSFTAPGYQDKIVNGAVQIGYRLVLNLTMATMEIVPTPTPTPIATPSAGLTPKPTTTVITPLPKQATVSATLVKPYVEILNTPTGFLRVRETASTGGTELAKVNPGDKFNYKETETTGWYYIEYLKGTWGYVSSQYCKLVK
ncbi:MAG: hypothetical protein ACD_61C00155G0001 [uncultured bacterium]|nr:MAG: hypothetical protein ACD_61C00155G0001 [uncultured bacterium]